MWKVKGEQLQCRQNGSNLIYSKLTILLLTVPLSLVWSDCSNMCTDCSTHRGGSNSTSLHAESSIALFSVVVCVDWGLADRNLLRITSESANNLQTHRIDVWFKHNIKDEGRTTNITRLHRYILTNSADEYTAMLAYKSISYRQRNFLWNDAAYLIKPLAYHFFLCTIPINDILLIRIVTFKGNN